MRGRHFAPGEPRDAGPARAHAMGRPVRPAHAPRFARHADVGAKLRSEPVQSGCIDAAQQIAGIECRVKIIAFVGAGGNFHDGHVGVRFQEFVKRRQHGRKPEPHDQFTTRIGHRRARCERIERIEDQRARTRRRLRAASGRVGTQPTADIGQHRIARGRRKRKDCIGRRPRLGPRNDESVQRAAGQRLARIAIRAPLRAQLPNPPGQA